LKLYFIENKRYKQNILIYKLIYEKNIKRFIS